MAEALDARHLGLCALAAAVGYAVVLFIDVTLPVRLLVWLLWMLLVGGVGYLAMPAWREAQADKALAAHTLLIESAVVVVLATVIRIVTT